jgi:hypothetical protein
VANHIHPQVDHFSASFEGVFSRSGHPARLPAPSQLPRPELRPSPPVCPAQAPGKHPASLASCMGYSRLQGRGVSPRLPSRTTSLPFKQAKARINALAYAESLLPADTTWVHVIMVLEQSENYDPDPRAYLALQGYILQRVAEWLHYQGLPGHFIWNREVQPRYGKAHTHVLMPLPPSRCGELERLIRKVGRLYDTSNNRAVVIRSNEDRGINTRPSLAGVMRDFLKTLSPKAIFSGVPIMPALAIDNRGQKPCTILGKRSGESESLGLKARKAAGWIELETLAELRAALPTKEDGQRERNRLKARRHRARRKAAGTSRPMPIRVPRSIPEPDLAADFLDA